ncbi:hypothetical protein [Spirosoma aerophilum]
MEPVKYKEPESEPEATKILRTIIRLEGAVIIEAIHQIIRTAQAEYDAMDAQIPSKNAREDRAFGKNLEVYYKRGVLPRLSSLAQEIRKEVPGDESNGFLTSVDTLHWSEFFSQNKRNLEGIAANLRRLLDQLL